MSLSSTAHNFNLQRTWLLSWLINTVLPFWQAYGLDHRDGGFFEKLDDNTVAIDEPRRARLVARQIFVFATAHDLGWNGPCAEIVGHGLSFLLDKMVTTDGVVTPALSAGGTVNRTGFDLYDCAFVLLALASAARLQSELHPMLEQRAGAVLDWMGGYAHAGGGFVEQSPLSGHLASNPHMHFLEALLAWERLGSRGSIWQEQADAIAALCLSRFIDRQTGAVGEYFDTDWRMLDKHEGQIISPGHQYEWAWLLLRWAKRRSRRDVFPITFRLVNIGENWGVDNQRGIVIDELCPDFSVRAVSARLWPQTERIKAWVRLAQVAADASSRHAALDRAACAIDGLRHYCAGKRPGMWWETIGPDGACGPEATRASSLYHIVCAAGELKCCH